MVYSIDIIFVYINVIRVAIKLGAQLFSIAYKNGNITF